MQLSRENGFFDVDGNERYVKKGVLYADDDPAVKALPGIFDKVSDDGPPPKGRVQAAVAAAKAAGKAADGG
jgi:hypothetical protein